MTKRVAAGAVGLGAIGGVTAVAVACGSTKTYDLRLYYEVATINPVTTRLSGDTTLRLWVPHSNLLSSTGTADRDAPVTAKIVEVLTAAGMNVSVIEGSTERPVGYDNAATTWGSRLDNREFDLLPDVIVNYPDLQAIIAKNDLAQSFGTEDEMRSIIAPALRFDATSVLTPKPGIYALPLLKTTELTYFDLIAFARLFNDIAAQKATGDTVTVPANSAQHRMMRMIRATPVNGAYADIYADDPAAVNGTVTYNWADLASSWATKTGAGGIWEMDAPVLRENFALREAGKAGLLSIDWSKAIFTSYDEILQLVKTLSGAYALKNATSPDGARFGSIDSTANTLYSYGYQKAGHQDDKFFMRLAADGSSNRVDYDFRPKVDGATNPLIEASQYVSDLVATKGIFARNLTQPTNTRGTTRLATHLQFFAWESTSAASAPFSVDKDRNPIRQFVNPGEVYYDLQPTKAALSEQKSSVINQGPSLLVTKVHGEATAIRVAKALFDAFKPGGAFTARWNDTTKRDDGFLGNTGRMYANATDNAPNSPFITGLTEAVRSSANWGSSVGKYLLSQYYSQVGTDPDKNTFTNPAGPSASYVRRAFDNLLIPLFLNNTPIAGADIVQRAVNRIVPDNRLQ